MQNKIVSVYTVTEYRTGNKSEEFIEGDGQAAATAVRALYPRHTKFVLEGFEINGNFIPLYIKYRLHY